jgi:hypothetical protein
MRDTAWARAWAGSGAMTLTGRADGPLLVAPDGIVQRIQALGDALGVDTLALAVERAALSGLTRNGTTSCGGSAQLLRASDGWVATNLARPDDLDMVPAWLGADVDPSAAAVASAIAARPSATLVASAAELGLAVSAVGEVPADAPPVVCTRATHGTPLGDGPLDRAPLVVDLSSLWAGPLCARLLAGRGARVLKVESVSRPDGARSGPSAFFDVMQSHAEAVALDFGSVEGRDALHTLVQAADVVIEASRRRALRHLGIDADALLAAPNGPRVWVSITGYGRDANRVAFGDDAAVAGGLVARDETGPCFALDAVADPLTGVVAATAVDRCLRAGGRWLLDVAMARVAAHVAGADRDARWEPGDEADALPPRAAPPIAPAPALGRDTAAIATEFGLRV